MKGDQLVKAIILTSSKSKMQINILNRVKCPYLYEQVIILDLIQSYSDLNPIPTGGEGPLFVFCKLYSNLPSKSPLWLFKKEESLPWLNFGNHQMVSKSQFCLYKFLIWGYLSLDTEIWLAAKSKNVKLECWVLVW